MLKARIALLLFVTDVSTAAFAEPEERTLLSMQGQSVETPTPYLPNDFWPAHPQSPVSATYKLCLDSTGSVSSTSVMASIGDATVDESVQRQLRDNWRYKPQAKPVCFPQPLRFARPEVGMSEASAASSPTSRPNTNVYLDPNVATSKTRGMAWTAYALTKVAAGTGKFGSSDEYSSELIARQKAVELWKSAANGERDAYLDQLAAVVDAGFLNEYVLAYFAQAGWVLSAERMRELRLDAFAAWRAQNLVKHVPETHARISATTKATIPGGDVMAGLHYRRGDDCVGLRDDLQHRVDSWQTTAAQLKKVPLVVANREQLVDVLRDPVLRTPMVARGVVLVSPQVAGLHRIYGGCAVEMGDLPRAEKLLRALIVLAPRDFYGAEELAHVLAKTNRLDEAMSLIDQTIATVPDPCNQAILWRKRGYIYFERKDWAKAKAAYEKSLELDPTNAIAHSELTLIAQTMGGSSTPSAGPQQQTRTACPSTTAVR